MESKLCKGLYFAGELLDIDGTCGGFNLQWAWSSGAVAGKNAAKEEKKLIRNFTAENFRSHIQKAQLGKKDCKNIKKIPGKQIFTYENKKANLWTADTKNDKNLLYIL